MLAPLEEQVAAYAKAHEMFRAEESVMLAVSGGADSTALLHIVAALRRAGQIGRQPVCAHINHGLRGEESDGDEAFVRKQAGELGLPVVAERVDVGGHARRSKISVETAGRACRMAALGQLARENGCGTIATGHQRNDNAETLVDRISRGTAYRGLGGIWPVRELQGGVRIVRPMLCVTREQIVTYLLERGLRWREDRTNRDCVHRRNFIRHRLLPALQAECTRDILADLSGLGESARALERRVSRAAQQAWHHFARVGDQKVVVEATGLLALPTLVKVELIRRALVHVGCGERDLSQRHYAGVLQLAGKGDGRGALSLPGDRRVALRDGQLVFAPAVSAPTRVNEPDQVQLDVPGRTAFGGYMIQTRLLEGEEARAERQSIGLTPQSAEAAGRAEWTERFDLDRVKLPIVVRGRRDGDRFRPLGMAGDKKVGKFLTGAGVAGRLRDRVVILCDQAKILWVCPVRMSDQAKVTDATRRVLRVRVASTVARAGPCEYPGGSARPHRRKNGP